MKTAFLFVMFVFAFAMGSCQKRSLDVVLLLDLTESVKPEDRAKAFDAAKGMAQHLEPGDSVTTAAITNNAAVEWNPKPCTVGEAQSYGEQRDQFSQELQSKFEKLDQEATAHPYQHSDVLGSLMRAGKKLAPFGGTSTSDHQRVIVVLSDQIQDDSQFDFKVDSRLAKEASAKEMARTLAQQSPELLKGLTVYFGLLLSRDTEKMPRERIAAISAFWKEYAEACGAKQVIVRDDGPGDLEAFLNDIGRPKAK